MVWAVRAGVAVLVKDGSAAVAAVEPVVAEAALGRAAGAWHAGDSAAAGQQPQTKSRMSPFRFLRVAGVPKAGQTAHPPGRIGRPPQRRAVRDGSSRSCFNSAFQSRSA